MSVLAARVADFVQATGAGRVPCVGPERDTPVAIDEPTTEEGEERDDSMFISLSFYDDWFA